MREVAPLRLLYHHRIAASDGMRVHITEVVAALRARGVIVQVVGPGGREDEVAAGGASRFERLAERLRRRLPGAVYEAAEVLYNLPAYLRLSAAAAAFRPDVIYERYNLFLLAGLWLRWRRRIPLVLEVNSPLAAERAEFGGLKLQSLARACETRLWRGADAVLPVTEALARHVRRVRGDRHSIHVIPNGARLTPAPPPDAAERLRARLGLRPHDIVLGFVGFVRTWHGLGWALEALPRLPPETHLLVVGDGPALLDLERRAEVLGVSARLHHVGRLPHEEVAAYMALFDVALQTAATPYASPLKLFEYMGLARAILAPNQPNIREILTDGRNGLLFSPRNEASFRSALQRLCEDKALRAKLGAAARRSVEETPLTWAHNAERIEALVRRLAAERPARALNAARGATRAASP